jgi:uncharacterized protein (DUF433 family)
LSGNAMATRAEQIQIDPSICHGKLVIRGTRVLVSTILGALGAGDSIETVLEDYPTISREDVRAALTFAGALADFEETAYVIAPRTS